MASLLLPYDLSRVYAQYPDPPRQRSALLSLCRAALTSERWDELLRLSRALLRASMLATPGQDLTTEERNIFAQAVKQNLSALRASWRACHVDAVSSSSSESERLLSSVSVAYRSQLERELLTLVSDIVTLVEQCILNNVNIPEAQIYYRKLVGDCYRYLAEVSVPGAAVLPHQSPSNPNPTPTPSPPPSSTGSASSVIPLGYAEKSNECYSVAHRVAVSQLDATHPTRLGLSLNYSVLLYEVFKDKKAACELARAAFDQAIARLDDLEESSYKDTTMLMQLLRDNITLWTAQDTNMQDGQAA